MSAGSFDLWFELRIATYCAIPRGFRLLPARPREPDFVVTTKRIPVLPLEIWRQIVAEFLPHPSNFPVYYAEARALIACVCKLWHVRVYADQSFWTYLCINQHVLLESLKFVLAKCPTALLDVRIALLDVDTRYDTWSPPEPPSTILNRLLSMISPTSLRWRSFFLITENPESFLDVFRSCEFLPAPKLRTLTVHYTLMEGYSSFESDDPIYFEPVDRRDWFGGALSNVTSLETCGIRMPGSVHSLVSALVSLNISQGYSESLFEWEFFVQLFSAAVHLRHLKLAAFAGVVVPRATPDRAKLESTSLRILDLTLDADAFAVSFIRLLAAPNLLDLTLRT
ncbi:hypothetical protein C8F04DRAFT_1179194, partial [Mycena alexandri]